MEIEENNQQPVPDNGEEQEGGDESFLEMLEASFDYTPPQRGEIRDAIILQVEPNEIIVDMGAKQDGIVTSQDLERLDPEYRESLQTGQTVPVYVLNPRDVDGNLIVSINMGLQQYDWDAARALLESDEVVEVEVTGHNRGGVLVRWKSLEGFIPSSHMVTVSAGLQGNERRETLDALRGEEIGVKVIEVDQDRRRLIFSEREAQREWRAQQKAKLLATLSEGDVVEGTVTGLRDFGAFVNLGGADGLIHVSELAWHRVDHPRDVLRVGQEIEVYVLSLDRKTNRIALSRKRLLPDPWDTALDNYFEGMLVEGTVTNVVDFGAFIALDDGLEGLLHLSEMGDGTLKEPHSYVKKGDRLQLRISRLEPDQRRVGFTQRWGVDHEEPISHDEVPAPEAVALVSDGEIEPEPTTLMDLEDEEAAEAVVGEVEVAEEAVEEEPEAEVEPEAEEEAEAEVVDEVVEEEPEAEVVEEVEEEESEAEAEPETGEEEAVEEEAEAEVELAEEVEEEEAEAEVEPEVEEEAVEEEAEAEVEVAEEVEEEEPEAEAEPETGEEEVDEESGTDEEPDLDDEPETDEEEPAADESDDEAEADEEDDD
jgi:small subunit ribosomal protein S1